MLTNNVIQSKMYKNSEIMDLGQFGEDKAVKYLISNGYTVLYRNFRCRNGEIDIVARDKERDDLIVFLEVKTRKNRGFGLPCEAVTSSKMQKMKKTISVYTNVNKYKNHDFRIDVIEILLRNGKIYIRHLKNVC